MAGTKFMIRRKFFVPKDEMFIDYRDGHEKQASNYLYNCDWEDLE